MRQRFQRIWPDGIVDPLPAKIAAALTAELQHRDATRYRVTLGARHWTPSIGQQVDQLAQTGIQTIIALPLSSHGSMMALRDYDKALRQAIEQNEGALQIVMVEHWHMAPGLLQTLSEHTQAALARFPAERRDRVQAIFCAHSVAESARKSEEGYRQQMTETASAITAQVGLALWHIGFHSAMGPGQWLEPDLLQLIDSGNAQGVQDVLVVALGAIYDNVELLYELDVEAVERANSHGMHLERAALPNTAPATIAAMADLIEAVEVLAARHGVRVGGCLAT
ncbi:MAG: ferrochelatase, partial [Chloroflexaceae bacterium]|nr:ferrochelatase [Chloroflexaceae bacterium]